MKSPFLTLRALFPLLLCAVLVLNGSNVGWSQTAGQQKPLHSDLLTTREDKVAAVTQLMKDGFLDKAVLQTTAWINTAYADPLSDGEADPSLFYLRGSAEFYLGEYDQAQKDLKYALSQVERKGWSTWISKIKEELAKSTALQSLLPPQHEDIRDPSTPKTVLFRVYYTQKDEFTQAILDALPAAYRANTELYGCRVADQTVIIFDTATQLNTFEAAQGIQVRNWAWAASNLQGFYICAETPQGKKLAVPHEELQDTVAHEYNHSLLRRTMGNTKLPHWFVEGLAMCVEGKSDQNTVASNEKRMARLIRAGLLVEPQKLESTASFQDITSEGHAKFLNGDLALQPSPYAQGYSMTTFLLSKLPKGRLTHLLNEIYHAKDFEKGFTAELGLTLHQFYEQWRIDATAQANAAQMAALTSK